MGLGRHTAIEPAEKNLSGLRTDFRLQTPSTCSPAELEFLFRPGRLLTYNNGSSWKHWRMDDAFSAGGRHWILNILK